jgi:plasmid stabilization system protein ParE
MASGQREMIVDYAPEALADLDEIWVWNAERYGKVHANSYVEFLQQKTDRLSAEYASGRPVPLNPQLQYRVIQKKKKRHGHIVVYEITGSATVRIIRYFHTAQDWHGKLSEESNEE